MNKKIVCVYGVGVIGLIVLLILSLKIFEIVYFNEEYYKVPNLKSYTLDEGEKILKGTTLNLKKVDESYSDLPMGQIFLQEPEPGEVVKRGRNIRVWISKGKALIDVPNLVGMNYLEAKVVAEQKGLLINKVVTVKAKGRYNEVLATDPATDTLFTRGEKISFLVNGAEQILEINMPDLVGLNFEEAVKVLTNNSLIVGNVEFTSIPGLQKNVIIKSSVKAGDKIPAGSSVDLTINN